MDNTMPTMAVAAARLLLQNFQEDHPDWIEDRTPLDDLIAWLGLQVETFHPDDYPQGTFGFIDPDEDEDLIWLRRDLPETFRRFTLAHELGHALLHCRGGSRIQALFSKRAALPTTQQYLPEPSRMDPCQEVDLQENMPGLFDQQQLQEILGTGQAYDPRSQRELSANIFAAELLMPDERLRKCYLAQRIPAATLAATFAVSNAAMLNRLSGFLKEPPPAELPTILLSPTRPTELPPPASQKQYDEFQRAAIEAATPALIVAGPGSGKTSTLIARCEYSIRTLGVQPQHILALTFSRKAAQEMQERLQQALPENTPLPTVSTFHAFCADLLRKYPTLTGLRADFTLLDEAEGYALLQQAANEMHLRHYQNLRAPTHYFPDILKAISRAKDELVSPDMYTQLAQHMLEQARDEQTPETIEAAEKALEVAHAYACYEQALQHRGDTDFGGLLTLAVQLLQQHPDALREQQQQYQHILVDEFQDMNRASGVLLRTLAGETRNVWVVGDANQAIYGFRGASPANINQFAADFPGATVLPLSRNYRSRPDLVALAESFRVVQLELGQEPGKNQPVRLTGSDTSVTLAKATDEACESAGLLQDIRNKHANGYAYSDMVILCRTRAHAQNISRALAAAGLPVFERGGLLEKAHIKDVLSILLLLIDTSGMGLLRAARQQEHLLSQTDIENFLLAAREQKISPSLSLLRQEIPLTISVQGHHALKRLAEILYTLQRTPDTWSLLAHYLLIETSLVRDLLADFTNNRTILADYADLLRLARHYDQQQQARWHQRAQEAREKGAPPPEQPSLEEKVRGLLEYLNLLVLLRQEGSNRQSAEEEEGANADIIRVMTVHASKGLEFPVVYMPYLVKQRFPSQKRSSPVSAPTGMLPPESVGSVAHENGESCLFYVGVTRARDHLILSYSSRYGKKAYKPSEYLDALRAGLTEERITHLHWDENSVGPLPTQQAATQTPLAQPSTDFINAMQPTTLSSSALEAYQHCPRKYAYSNIYHFSSTEDGYRLFWQATQQTLEDLHQQMKMQPGAEATELPTPEQVQELYTQHWQTLGGHTSPFANMYEEHGQEIAETLRRQLISQSEEWQMRPAFDVDVAGKTVRVTVDRIESATQATPVKFVRTRFGKSKAKPTVEAREMLYTLAYRQQHPNQQVELLQHNLSTGETLPIKMTPKKEQSLYTALQEHIEALARNEYPAEPTNTYNCPTCPFFLICPI